jgi:hypothetical protein
MPEIRLSNILIVDMEQIFGQKNRFEIESLIIVHTSSQINSLSPQV